jgi:hypothetical protein
MNEITTLLNSRHHVPNFFVSMLLSFALSLSLHSCSDQAFYECPNGLEPFQQITLYFGLSSPDSIVSDIEWQNYLEEVVTPNFPEGFTVFDSYGQWKNPDNEIINEPGKVLTHLYNLQEDKNENINAIIDEFKERHQAQSVIREKNLVCVSF